MIRPEQIPDEVVEAHISILERMMIGPPTKKSSRAAIAAALNAWQGIQGAWYEGDTPTAYIIPLPQEKHND
jgi:hypothetical protein